MSSLFRRFSVLLGSIGLAVLLASCTDRNVQTIATPEATALKPGGPSFGYSPIHGCDNLTPATMCTGSGATMDVRIETLRVCKVYSTGSGPDVQIKLNADYVMFQDGPQQSIFTVKSGQCLTLWRNGEETNGVRSADVITVTELPVPGYTTQSQVTTIIRDQDDPGGPSTFTTTVGPVTSATTITSNIGGAKVPGTLIVFTNTAIPENQQPTPIANGPYFGVEGSPVTFSSAGTSDPEGDPLTYLWDFGDGATSTAQNPTHTYADNGVYPVTITVDDGQGHPATASTTATIVNVPPVPTATVANATLACGQPAAFTGTFTDAGVIDQTWTWSINWGDGSPATTGGNALMATPITANHDYGTNSGPFTITLTVTDKDGGAGTATTGITNNCSKSTIGDFVWNDLNGNGIQDSGEPGIAGVIVSLSSGPTTTTDANGAYSFPNLSPGSYIVTVATPAGYVASPTGAGTPSTDSNGSGTSVTVSGGTNNTVDFGFYKPVPAVSCVNITAVKGTAIVPVTLTASGGAGAPYTFTATGLPAGLSISTGGTISGTPTASGTSSYTVTVKDKNGTPSSSTCTVTVSVAPTATCVSINAIKGIAIVPVTLTGTGGAGGPYTFTATGLPAGLSISSSGTISGTPTVYGTFTYTVTITDKNGNKGTITCTVVVAPPDTTAPVCSVYANGSPAYMTFQDGGSGIVRLDVITNLNSNYKVTISPAPTGTTYSPSAANGTALVTGTVIKFPTGITGVIKTSAIRVSTSKSSQLTIKATDAAGKTVTCDPVETTVMKMKNDNGDQTFNNLPYEEHFITVENGGLKSIDIIVNGTTFKMKRLDDTEKRTIDVSSAMKHSNKNTITLSPNGKKGETADVTIGPDPDQ
ncbi:MAG: PKD domain-containing protein [Gemmatimonadaceae bacterium]